MNTDQKTLRLALSLVVALVGLCGCNADSSLPSPTLPVVSASPTASAPSPTITIIPTLAPTQTPTGTPTPQVTPTPTPSGVLTQEESQRLYESSLAYIAPTPAEAITVARSLRFLVNDGHPSNMCGPLALAILRDAGLVDQSVILHDFWLLNPSEPSDQWLLESTFPRNRYLWRDTPVSTAELDFTTFPLQAGDLLYLFAGPGGTFDHVIVVTRVDGTGKAFSVTNVNTDQGFIINEVMLYDPHQPGAGKFYEWTDPDNLHLGLTGRGGFRLWRRVESLHTENSAASTRLTAAIDGLLRSRGGHWNVVIKKVGGDLVYHRGAEEIQSSPWAIEITTAMLFFHILDLQGVDDYEAYLAANGIHGRTFQQLLEAMLVNGELAATRTLADWVDKQIAVAAVLQDWGLYQTALVSSQSIPLDIATITEGLYSGRLGTAGGRALILEQLRKRGSSRTTSSAVLHTYVDRAHANEVRQFVVAQAEEDTYVLVIYGSPPRYGENETSVEELGRTAEEIIPVFIDEYLMPTIGP